MPPTTHPVTLCGRRLSGSQHICAFFDSRDEQYRILNPYFREGLENGEEVVTVVEAAFRDEHLRRLRAGGVPADSAAQTGQLKLRSSEDTYVPDGVFAAERMFALLEDTLRTAARGPYGRVRTCGDMEWALRSLPGSDELMAYEARVNLLIPRYDCSLLCVYDVNQFSGRAVADVLATHSHVILGGRMYENPYFVEPVSYLQTLALRRRPAAPMRAGWTVNA
jgi:hypothetical protein